MKRLIAMFLVLSSPAYAGGVRAEIEACSVIHCEVVDISPENELGLMECAMGIQPSAAKWLHDNKPPGWYIRRMTCTTEVRKVSM